MRNNDFDIQLLYKDPNAFVEAHQETVSIIVNKLIRSGFFAYQERDDLVQFINESLLTDKIAKMQKQYKPEYFVVTYLSKIIHNLCLEYSRKFRKAGPEESTADISQLEISDDETISRHIMIQEEGYRLDSILKMYYKEHKRIEIFLRVFFGIGINRADILQLYPQAGEQEISAVLEICNPSSDAETKTDKELYETLTKLMNKYEEKQKSPDALRKWLHVKMAEIIELLNGDPKTANYDKETLKILFQFKYKNLHFRVSK